MLCIDTIWLEFMANVAGTWLFFGALYALGRVLTYETWRM